MSHQLTFADSEFSTKRRQTRKEIFLSRMEQILPWQNMTAVIEPFYPKAGNGRRPYPLEGNDSNLLIVFYVQIMPDDFVMQLHR
ncbi:hypothetical protein P0231_25020, partial [Escherichia coli]